MNSYSAEIHLRQGNRTLGLAKGPGINVWHLLLKDYQVEDDMNDSEREAKIQQQSTCLAHSSPSSSPQHLPLKVLRWKVT